MDMSTFSPALPMFLLLAALAIGIWQRLTVGGPTSARSTRAAQASIVGTPPRGDVLATGPLPATR